MTRRDLCTVVFVFYRAHVVAGEGDDSRSVERILQLRARKAEGLRERALSLAIKLGRRHACHVQVWDIG